MRKSQHLSVLAFISSSLSNELLVVDLLQNTGIPALARFTLREEAQKKWPEKSGFANEPKKIKKIQAKRLRFLDC